MSKYFHKVRNPPITIKSFIFRGFKIEIQDNRYYSFRYEWVVTAISKDAIKICKRNHKGQLIFYDPTSMPNMQATLDYAITQVCELASPLCFKLSELNWLNNNNLSD